jgi:hypothetical protein
LDEAGEILLEQKMATTPEAMIRVRAGHVRQILFGTKHKQSKQSRPKSQLLQAVVQYQRVLVHIAQKPS